MLNKLKKFRPQSTHDDKKEKVTVANLKIFSTEKGNYGYKTRYSCKEILYLQHRH